MSHEITVNGRCFDSLKDAARTLHVSTSSLRRYRRDYGISNEEAFEILVARAHRAKDHRGQTFRTTTEMCKAHGVTYRQFIYRMNKGCSVAECLDPRSRREQGAVDHLGNKFKSISEMCRHYGIYKNTFVRRLQRGLPLKVCLGR